MTEIRTIRMGTCNTYLVGSGENRILVDAGNRNRVDYFKKKMEIMGVKPEWIRLIVVTHAHYDHVGSLSDIRALCGCVVAVHALESNILEEGRVTIPPGTNFLGRMVSSLGRALTPKWMQYKPMVPDIRIEDNFSLETFGVPARIVSTPGHTMGSISLITEDGQACVGDMAFNLRPFNRHRVMPPFAENVPVLMQTWRKMLDHGVSVFYPSHGQRFSSSDLQREFDRCRPVSDQNPLP